MKNREEIEILRALRQQNLITAEDFENAFFDVLSHYSDNTFWYLNSEILLKLQYEVGDDLLKNIDWNEID